MSSKELLLIQNCMCVRIERSKRYWVRTGKKEDLNECMIDVIVCVSCSNVPREPEGIEESKNGKR